MARSVSGRRRFRLRKWYLDLVTPEGVVLIGYHAVLRWGWLRARYAAVLVSTGSGATQEWTTLRPAGEPAAGGSGIGWACPALQLEGHWHPTAPAAELVLLDGPAGMIRWSCLAPAADAAVRLGPAIWAGRGYVECLDLSVPPWALPFGTLHWGRYHGNGDSVVWILWDEGGSGAWALQDGVACAHVALYEEGLDLGGSGRLQLGPPRTLRAAPLAGVLAPLPRLLARIPRAFLAAKEEKWLSRARFQERSSGWAVHERVRLR